jgi:hypothetical protein
MPTERSLLLVSAVLQTVALTFGLAFLGMWKGFRRTAARWWALAWLAYACASSTRWSTVIVREPILRAPSPADSWAGWSSLLPRNPGAGVLDRHTHQRDTRFSLDLPLDARDGA